MTLASYQLIIVDYLLFRHHMNELIKEIYIVAQESKVFLIYE